ncbi:ADA, partial [Symbiodinium necroappetens]
AGKPEDEHQRAASANPRCERSTEELLLAAPKVELHVHLDGSFDAAVLFRAAQAHLEELPEKVRTPWDGKMLEVQKAVRECHGDLAKFTSLVTVGSDIIGLFPILDCFYTFLPIVRGRFELLEELAFEFCRERKKHNIIYTEVRYSPFEFLPQGEDGQIADTSKAADAVKAVCAGLRKGQAEFGVMVHQILCCIAAQPAWSAQTMVLAEEFRNEGVVGVDIAAGEMHFEDGALHDAHRDAMAMAQKKGLGITVHAAEAGPGDNVCRAMDVYGATRIGHGYRSVGMQAYNYARSKGVHFELCPTSSVSTQAIELEKADGSLQWKTHPISRFFLDGTSCSINSDDPAVFRSSLTDELVICVKEMGLSLENIQWMTLEALEHAFHLESGVKDTIAEKVKGLEPFASGGATQCWRPAEYVLLLSLHCSERTPTQTAAVLATLGRCAAATGEAGAAPCQGPSLRRETDHVQVKMEKEEEEDDTNALDALIAAASSRKGVATKTEAVKSEPVKTEAVKTEKVKAEEEDDDDTEEEEDPLMGRRLNFSETCISEASEEVPVKVPEASAKPMAQPEREAAIVKRVFRRYDKLGDGTVDRDMLWKVMQTLPSKISLQTFLHLLQQTGYDGGRVNYVRFLDRLFSENSGEDTASDSEDATSALDGWRRLLLTMAKFHAPDEAFERRSRSRMPSDSN